MTGDDAAWLRISGQAMHGAEWQRALARDLGPLHPDGPRDAIDDSLVWKWARCASPIPAWVRPAVADLLASRAAELRGGADRCLALADALRDPPG